MDIVRRSEVKPFVMMYEGHDLSLAFWLPKTNEWVIYEIERIARSKHYTVMRAVYGLYESDYTTDTVDQLSSEVTSLVKFCLENLEKDFGIKNDFQTFYVHPQHPFVMGEGTTFDYSVINAPLWQIHKGNHHEGHQWSAYIQAPFARCACISWDAGGDNTQFMYGEFDFETDRHSNNGEMKIRDERPYFRPSYMWQLIGVHMGTINKTPNALDFAGKMMGLSAYGKKHHERAEELIPRISYWMTTAHNKNLVRNQVRDWMKEEFSTDEVFGEDEQILAYAIQTATERVIIDFIKNEFIDRIHKMDNQLILTGGTAMNILANEAIKREFPELKLFVPCNPSDDGISCGMMSREIPFLPWEQFGRHVVEGNYDFKYAGPYLFDHQELPRYVEEREARTTNLREVANLLKSGKIIGLLNGRSEVGPRALGNRSILCDPSQPNMKDTLNAKVKFREWYRPFAPVCKLEDADKYFDSRDYEMMDAMQFGISVKPEWQNHLTEITHEDGSARLQTVTEKSNRVFYKLLNEFDGVLLNTSFNVQGKPILNTIRDALDILDKTQLDYVVVIDKETNQPYLFT